MLRRIWVAFRFVLLLFLAIAALVCILNLAASFAHADSPIFDGLACYRAKTRGETFTTDAGPKIYVQPAGFGMGYEECDLKRHKPFMVCIPADIQSADEGPYGTPLDAPAYLLYLVACGKTGLDFTEALDSRLGDGLVTANGKPGPTMVVVPATIFSP
ncbi:MAG: hypothetical protein AAB367_04525 [Patescibacteria group bacterium]